MNNLLITPMMRCNGNKFCYTSEEGKAPQKKSGLLENNTWSLEVVRPGKVHLEKNDHDFPFLYSPISIQVIPWLYQSSNTLLEPTQYALIKVLESSYSVSAWEEHEYRFLLMGHQTSHSLLKFPSLKHSKWNLQ